MNTPSAKCCSALRFPTSSCHPGKMAVFGGFWSGVKGWYGGGREFSFVFISSSVERAPLLSDQFSCASRAFHLRPRALLQLDFHPHLPRVCMVLGWSEFFHFFSRGSKESRFLIVESKFLNVHIVPFFVFLPVMCVSIPQDWQIQNSTGRYFICLEHPTLHIRIPSSMIALQRVSQSPLLEGVTKGTGTTKKLA